MAETLRTHRCAPRDRPSEEVRDGRRWSFGKPDFVPFITIVGHVLPSELDYVELGQRVALVHAEAVVSAVEFWHGSEFRVLHPAEVSPVVGAPSTEDEEGG